MGGADSEVSESTATIVLEAANFTRAQILRTSQALGLRSDGLQPLGEGRRPPAGAGRPRVPRPV